MPKEKGLGVYPRHERKLRGKAASSDKLNTKQKVDVIAGSYQREDKKKKEDEGKKKLKKFMDSERDYIANDPLVKLFPKKFRRKQIGKTYRAEDKAGVYDK